MLVRQLPTPDPRLRWLTVIGLALFSACGTWLFRSLPQPYPSDFWPIWQGARLFLHGQNPYPIIGTDAAPFPTALMYPLPALLTAIPLAWLPIRVVDPLVVGLAGGIFAWWLTRDGWSPGLLLFFSMPWRYLMQVSQGWDAASLLAVSVPWVGFLLVGKPTIGAAVWFMRPRVSSALMAVAMVAVSLLIWPTWIPAWRAAVATAGHFQDPLAGRVDSRVVDCELARPSRAAALRLVLCPADHCPLQCGTAVPDSPHLAGRGDSLRAVVVRCVGD